MKPSSEWQAVLALLIMGALSAALIFRAVPQSNTELITFALGAIAGALTIGGGQKLADKITGSNVTGNTTDPQP